MARRTTQKHSPELIAELRRLAAERYSAAAAALEVSTRERVLTRSAVLGIAHRNGFQFNGVRSAEIRPRQPRRYRRNDIKRLKPEKPPVMTTYSTKTFMAVAKLEKPPVRSSRCAWKGCELGVEPGDMFCFSHGRKGLMA